MPSQPLQSAPQRSPARGFSLLEVLIVLALIGVLSAGFAWSMSAVDDAARLRNAGEDLEVFLFSLSTQAALTGAPIRLELTPGHGAVRAGVVQMGVDPEPLDHELAGGASIEALRLDGSKIDRDTAELIVQPSGYLRGFDVQLRSGHGLQWARWDPVEQRIKALEGVQ